MSSASAIMALALASSCQMRETLALSETQFAGNMYSGPKLSARKDITDRPQIHKRDSAISWRVQ